MEEFSRIQRLPPYVFNITGEMKVAARRRGEDIIDFGMGNPDGATPKHIVDKMVEAAMKPVTHRYSVSKGLPRLRRAITNWYKSRYDVDLDPDSEAIVTIGSKEGIAHLCLAILDSRDTVLVPNPSYPIHIYGPVIAGAHVVSVPIVDQGQFLAQLIGIATLLGLILPIVYLLFALLNRVVPFRVEPDGERIGMDLHELGGGAYPEFVVHRDDSYR